MSFTYQEGRNDVIIGISDDPSDIIIPSHVIELKTNFLSEKTTETISFEDGSMLTTIGDSCFANLNTLIKANFTNCLKLSRLSFRCFFYCTKLEVCILPENGAFTVLSRGSFAYCSSLKNFTFPSTCRVFENHSTGSTSIFDNCRSLERIYFPVNSKLENIGTFGFIDCHKLTDVRLPLSMKKLENNIFTNCKSLKTLYIPSEVMIHSSAFEDSSIEKVFYIYPKTRNSLIAAKIGREKLIRIKIAHSTCLVKKSERHTSICLYINCGSV